MRLYTALFILGLACVVLPGQLLYAQAIPPTMMLSPAGAAASPGAISFNPTSLSFSTTAGTPSSPQTVTATNNGGSTFNISSISIAGTNAADFSQTNTCGATLAVGVSCNISVIFNRATAGTSTANVAVTGT